MPASRKARTIGISQVALEVGDIDEALALYGAWPDFELRGRSDTLAFIDLGKDDEALAELAQKVMAPARAGNRARD